MIKLRTLWLYIRRAGWWDWSTCEQEVRRKSAE